MSRLMFAFLVMIVSYEVLFVNIVMAAIDDDLQVVYTMNDAKLFLVNNEPFKVGSVDDWLGRDQNLLDYAYKSNLTESQLWQDIGYKNMVAVSLKNRDKLLKSSISAVRKHNIARAKKLEERLLTSFSQGEMTSIDVNERSLVSEIVRKKPDWLSSDSLNVTIQRYEHLLKPSQWSIDSCRSLESEFSLMRMNALARFKYFSWEKKHDLFYHDDSWEMDQLRYIRHLQGALDGFLKELGKSDIDTAQSHPTLAALHESQWKECQRILDRDMPAKYKELSVNISDLTVSFFDPGILEAEEQSESVSKLDMFDSVSESIKKTIEFFRNSMEYQP